MMCAGSSIDRQETVVICVPIYNDWDAAATLLRWIDEVVTRDKIPASVLIVDDGSTDPPPGRLPVPCQSLQFVELLKLRRNVGHQRAIALGLAYVHKHVPCRCVIVMDGDGEDSPDDIPKLLHQLENNRDTRIVFARRSRRTESLTFRILYQLYKIMHGLLTGRAVEVGNFSVIPSSLLERLVGVSELWSHYAAAVVKSKMPHDKVDIPRATRLQGKSKMSFVGLVAHGLSAMAVFSEDIGVRLLSATSILVFLAAGGLAMVLTTGVVTDTAIPGWAATASGVLFIILLYGLLLSLAFVFVVLQGRSRGGFLPLRDYEYYVISVTRLTDLG
jgi:hypothetical protein